MAGRLNPRFEETPQARTPFVVGRLTRGQTWFLHVSVALATLTGIVYAWMKYFVESDDPFAVANHPWQPTLLHLHIVAVPLLVYGLGWIASAHIGPKYRSKTRIARRSGLVMMLLAGIMIFSGYVLQVLTGEAALKWSAIVHWISSGVFVAGYLIHQVVKPSGRPQDSR